MSIDGRGMASEVLARTAEFVTLFGATPRIIAIVANETAATKSYLSIKSARARAAGCELEVVQLSEDSGTETLCDAVRAAAVSADAVIVQLPLPSGVDTKQVCDCIPVAKDADVLSSAAREKFEKENEDALLPPVVGAVREIFEQNAVVVEGKHAVVLGAGFLVGAPVATWLKQQGAEVTVLTLESGDVTDEQSSAGKQIREADIIVAGAGSPHLIKPDMLKEGVILIDAGTSELGGEVVGDADPLCAEKCSIFTPVPGGVGPIAVACLFENAATLLERGY